MNENIIVLNLIAYASMLILVTLAFVHAGDFIAYLLKKFPPEAGHPKRAHADSSRKPRRSTGVA